MLSFVVCAKHVSIVNLSAKLKKHLLDHILLEVQEKNSLLNVTYGKMVFHI